MVQVLYISISICIFNIQFWSEIILVISNRNHATLSFDFEIKRMISDQIALHSVQLPLFITYHVWIYQSVINDTREVI